MKYELFTLTSLLLSSTTGQTIHNSSFVNNQTSTVYSSSYSSSSIIYTVTVENPVIMSSTLAPGSPIATTRFSKSDSNKMYSNSYYSGILLLATFYNL